jgi:hypothetical protein
MHHGGLGRPVVQLKHLRRTRAPPFSEPSSDTEEVALSGLPLSLRQSLAALATLHDRRLLVITAVKRFANRISFILLRLNFFV